MKVIKNRLVVFIPIGIALLSFIAGGFVAVHLMLRENINNTQIVVVFLLTAFILTGFLLLLFRYVLGRVKKSLEENFAKQKAMEDELRQTELEYRQIFDGVNDAIFVESTRGEVLDVNARACEIFGWTREEFLTKTVKDMVPPEHRALLPEEQDESAISEEPFETINIRANGERFPVSISGSIQKFGDEKRLLIVLRDITEQKKAEEELKKLSRAVIYSPASVEITDLEGTIEYVNPAFTKITGYTKEEVLGANPRVLKSGKHDDDYYKELWETIYAGETWRGELCNRTKSGDIFWESASISPVFNTTGEITHFVAVKEDITEQKKVEEELHKLSRAVTYSPTPVVITDDNAKINYDSTAKRSNSPSSKGQKFNIITPCSNLTKTTYSQRCSAR